jgi:hypothetical protein
MTPKLEIKMDWDLSEVTESEINWLTMMVCLGVALFGVR